MTSEMTIDTAAVYAAADRFAASAAIIDTAVHGPLAGLSFTGALAGRAHAERGDTLRRRLDMLAGELAQWSRASEEIAAALRVGAGRYAETERYGAARIA